jgi:hypothetical protein
MKRVGFFIRHFTERGSEVSTYEYAHYNETILGNRSYIICCTEEGEDKYNFGHHRFSFDKFEKRFPIVKINSMEDMKEVIRFLRLDIFYAQTGGSAENWIYAFDRKDIWNGCKTIKHSVFQSDNPEADLNLVLHSCINDKYKTNQGVLSYVVQLPDVQGNLRQQLGIPESATVFGGYGGKDSFSIPFVKQVVYVLAQQFPNLYFLFANFTPFCPSLPNIIHLPAIVDSEEKVKFIQTCDAMLWGRYDGETFGLAIAEFSIKNRPVFCCKTGDIAHLELLKERAIIYTDPQDLANKLVGFNKEAAKKLDWNAYRDYEPEKVMLEFQKYLV